MSFFGRARVAGLERRGDVDGLRKELDHRSADVVTEAIAALARLGDTDGLLTAAASGSTTAAEAAIRNLGEQRDPAAVEPLIALVEEREELAPAVFATVEKLTRASIVGTVRQIGGPRANAVLLEYARSAGEGERRRREDRKRDEAERDQRAVARLVLVPSKGFRDELTELERRAARNPQVVDDLIRLLDDEVAFCTQRVAVNPDWSECGHDFGSVQSRAVTILERDRRPEAIACLEKLANGGHTLEIQRKATEAIARLNQAGGR
jgi:HEAT repeat protein